ncbi:MAG: hypothetical protein K2Q32_03475 [Alphaproteobacteria bacterium]|nr:hypothetical protein [Alphaproteobacteria bacterium]
MARKTAKKKPTARPPVKHKIATEYVAVLTPEQRVSNLMDKIGAYLPDFDRAKDLKLALDANQWAEDLVSKYHLAPQEDIVADRIAVAEALCRYAKVGRTTFLAALLYPAYVQLVKPPPYSKENPDHLKLLEQKLGDEHDLGKNVSDIIRTIIAIRNINLLPSLGEESGVRRHVQSEEERHERFLMMTLFESAKEPRASLIRQTEMFVRLKASRSVIEPIKQTYMPLASMSGFWSLRNAMANTVLRYEQPQIYGAIKNFRKKYAIRFADPKQDKSHVALLEKIKEHLATVLTRVESDMSDDRFSRDDFKIDVRMKSLESIYRKLESKGVFKKFVEDGVPKEKWGAEITKILESGKHIHDFIGARVTLSDDYIARKAIELNVSITKAEELESLRVHGILREGRMDVPIDFIPDAKRDKNYVTTPKDNGYSAVHGTYAIVDSTAAVTDAEKKQKMLDTAGEIEVQSGSERMFHQNEYGSAAHVSYKAKGSKLKAADLTRTWLRVMREACQKKLPYEYAGKQIVRSTGGVETTRAVQELIAVYAGNNDIIYLPEGSTVADLAAKLRIVASAVGVSTFERANYLAEFRAIGIENRYVHDPENPSVDDLRIRLQNGDRVEIKLDKEVLEKELRSGHASRQSVIIASLTNSDAQTEVKRYFRNRKSSASTPTAPK